jgi:hypothetical protein
MNNITWKNLLCKVCKFTILKSKFFPAKNPFPKEKRKISREKIYSSKEWILLCKGTRSTLLKFTKIWKLRADLTDPTIWNMLLLLESRWFRRTIDFVTRSGKFVLYFSDKTIRIKWVNFKRRKFLVKNSSLWPIVNFKNYPTLIFWLFIFSHCGTKLYKILLNFYGNSSILKDSKKFHYE